MRGGGTGVGCLGNGRIVIIVVGGGTQGLRGGSAVVLWFTDTSVERIHALVVWWAKSGGGGGREEGIGVIALLPAVCVSRITAAASTNRTRTHDALSVGDDVRRAARPKRNDTHLA